MISLRGLASGVRLMALAAFVLIILAGGLALWTRAVAQQPTPDPQALSVFFATGNCTVTEGDSVTLTICLSQPPTQVVTVQFTAAISIDGIEEQYTDLVQFNPGETTKTATYSTMDDTCCQGPATIVISLCNPQGAQLGSPATISVTVMDNDICP